jgi:hypothetical protein
MSKNLNPGRGKLGMPRKHGNESGQLAREGSTLIPMNGSNSEMQDLITPSEEDLGNPIGTNQSLLSPEPRLVDVEIEEEAVVVDKRVIRIARIRRISWDLFLMLLAIWNALSIPFFIAWQPSYENSWSLFFINTLIDLIFCVDIVLNFFTSYIDINGEEETDLKKIVRHYLRRNFTIDLIASVPIDNFIQMFAPQEGGAMLVLSMTDMLKLIRILRLGRIIRLMRVKSQMKFSMRLMMLVMYLLLWVHFTGCIWFIVIRDEEVWIPVPDWGSETEFYHMDNMS